MFVLRDGYARANLISAFGTFVTSGATQSKQCAPPNGVSGPLLQNKLITQRFSLAETWVPVGVTVVVSATQTGTIPVMQLRKNLVAPIVTAPLSGTATAVALLTAGVDEVFIPFTPWSFAAADLPTDKWSVLVTTTSTLGTFNEMWLVYALRTVIGAADGVSI